MRSNENMTIEELISECTAYDFKLMLEEKRPKSWLKSVSAFANGMGGSLFFGVGNDGVIVGLIDIQSVTEKISSIVKERMDPLPDFEAIPHKVSGLEILEIRVQSGKYSPYYYVGDGQRVAFVRIGDESVQASAEQMVRLVLKGANMTFDSLVTATKIEDSSFNILANTFKQRIQQPWNKEYLQSFGLVTEDGRLTNAGVLFSDDCSMRQSRLYCTRWDGTEKDNAINDSEYYGTILLLLRAAQDFVKANTRKGWEKLPNGKKIKEEYSERAILEGLVNHFIHRDYTVVGGEVHLDIYDDRIALTSPGGMYNGTLIQEQDYREVPSERRNPILADVMAQLDYMEKRGSGLRKIYNATRELDGYNDALHPVFKSSISHFSTTIYRVNEAPDVPIGSPIELTERQTVILNIIKTDVTITSRRLSQKIGVVERTIKRDLADLQKKGLLKRIGGRKAGHWEIEGSNTRL